MIDVYLLLGSNMGDRAVLLEEATREIEKRIAPIIKSSSVYETQAWGKMDVPDYLNQVLLLHTEKPAMEILNTVLEIEQGMGRERKERWGSRTIDIDILFYGQEVIDKPRLTVPHPQLHNRKFTLEPLAEIAADFLHPIIGKTMAQLNELDGGLVVKRFIDKNIIQR